MHIAHLHITQINVQLHISGQKEVCKILQDLQKVCKILQDLQIFLQKFRKTFWQTLNFSRIFQEVAADFFQKFGSVMIAARRRKFSNSRLNIF